MKQYALLFACLFFLCVGSKAQEQPTRWTLRACLDYALEHNIQVKKSKVSHLSGIEDTKQAKAQLFPSLSASVTQGFVNYPSSDAATNNSYSGNYALNAKWTLFDGGQRVQAIKQQEIQNTVDELGIEQNEDDIQISLIQTYMQWSPFVSTKIRSRYLRRNGIVRWSCYVPVRSRKWIWLSWKAS